MSSATCPVCKRKVRTVVPRGGDGSLYRVRVTTAEACAEANRLIALGRWRVFPNDQAQRPVPETGVERNKTKGKSNE